MVQKSAKTLVIENTTGSCRGRGRFERGRGDRALTDRGVNTAPFLHHVEQPPRGNGILNGEGGTNFFNPKNDRNCCLNHSE